MRKFLKRLYWYICDGQFELLTITLWTGFSISFLSVERSAYTGSLFHIAFCQGRLTELDILYLRYIYYKFIR